MLRDKILQLKGHYATQFHALRETYGIVPAINSQVHGAMVALDEVLAVIGDPADDGPEVDIILNIRGSHENHDSAPTGLYIGLRRGIPGAPPDGASDH